MDRNLYAVSVRGVDKVDSKQPSPQEKLLKLFPAEALALYATLEPLLDTGLDSGPLAIALWGALFVSVIFCVLYLKKFWQVERKSQIAISCSALVLYVAALGGPFATLSHYDPLVSAVASVIATSFLLFVKVPTPPDEN